MWSFALFGTMLVTAVTSHAEHVPPGNTTPRSSSKAPVASARPTSESVFDEGKVYETGVGANELGGKMTVVRRGGRFELTVPILFTGAGIFSRTTPEDAKNVSLLTTLPPKEWFSAGQYNLGENAGIRERLEKICREIEAAWTTDFCQLKIEPIFVDERIFLAAEELTQSDASLYETHLREALKRRTSHRETMPIVISSTADPARVGPTGWDLYSNPLLFAHELGHVLGIRTEGYARDGYPANAVMNDEVAWEALKRMAPEIPVRITQRELREVLLGGNWGDMSRTLTPPVDRVRAAAELTAGAIDDVEARFKTGADRGEYLNWSSKKRREVQEAAVRKWYEATKEDRRLQRPKQP